MRLVLPVAKGLLDENGEIVCLIKPQFEAGKDKVGKKGIVREKEIHFDVIKGIIEFCAEIHLGVMGLTFSPITGATGNIEFLAYLKNGMENKIDDRSIFAVIEEAHNTLS